MKNSWEKDVCLRPLLSHINDYDIFSFDVFDTVLFRTCGEPETVFELTGRMLEGRINGWAYSHAAFKSLRKEAEQRARSRKPHGADCTLDEILAEMPFTGEIIKQMRQLEIDCENRTLYLNQNIYSFMCDCAARGKKIVLASDMYHGREQILSFLANAGVDTGIISDCFISSEYGCMKSDGELFRKILAAYPGQEPGRVLHIGDSMKADVEGAEKAGIQAIHYVVVPREFGSIYDFEKLVYDIELGELTSLRKLAAATHQYASDSEAAFFHALGAEVIGPVYSLFAEWVINYANERGIRVILPFMREGELLAKVISKAIEATGLNIECSPLFVSRRPAFASGIFNANYSERISQTLVRGGRTLRAIFEELGLDIDGSGFEGTAECTMVELEASGRSRELETYLYSGEVKSAVLRYSAEQRRLLIRYLQRMTGGQPSLTVDIGTKGTTERYLNDIGKYEPAMPPLSHVLMMGSMASNTDNILNGINISAWLGIAGENHDIITKIMYQVLVLETFVNASCGTILLYKERDGEVCPVLEQESVSEYQKQMVEACWGGIETFQDYWLSLKSGKKGLSESLLNRKRDFLKVLLRFIEMPTKREAEIFGSLYYLDGFNSKQPEKLAGAMPESVLNDREVKSFITAELKNGSYWPQAAVAVKLSGYFNRLLLNSVSDDTSYGAMLSILEEIKTGQHKTGVIFGASELGRKFLKLAQMLNVSPTCFVDSDKRLHGTVIDGLEVRPLNEAPANTDYFVIASYIYAKEIRTILEAKYPDKAQRPVFYDFGG